MPNFSNTGSNLIGEMPRCHHQGGVALASQVCPTITTITTITTIITIITTISSKPDPHHDLLWLWRSD